MIVSDKYRYVFVEQPLTASTAIASELVGSYDGREMLSKHSNYADFWRAATPEQRRYRVIIGARNPLDQIVSSYQKLITNHLDAYDDPKMFEENGGWISKRRREMFRYACTEGHSFEEYFMRFFGKPKVKTSQYLWSPRRYDCVIRFERIQEDFARFLALVGATKVRDIPVINKTAGKRHFLSYYTAETRDTARYVFGPLMSAWGYDFPADWPERRVPGFAMLYFRTVNSLARLVVSGLGITPAHYQRLRASLARGHR